MIVYHPIVRTFGRVRLALVSAGVARHQVRPGALLEALLPIEGRRTRWDRLRQEFPQLPRLELSPRALALTWLAVLVPPAALALALWSWAGLLAVFPLGFLAYRLSRPWAVHLPVEARTVGELTIALTSVPEHRGSGYRWTHNEIALKVRLVVAESLNVPLDAVRPESTLSELGTE